MFSTEILKQDFHNNTQFLKDTIADIPESILTKEPGESKWSILTIVDHLRVTDKGIYRLGQTQASPTDRSPMIMIHKIKEVLLDHDLKLPAPKAVLPYNDGKSKEELILELEEIRNATLEQGESLGWHEILDNFPHPMTGTMTRLEWLYFCVYHTERHIHQIDRIKTQFKTA